MTHRLVGLAAAAAFLGATSCFPTLPNEYEITNLRVLAIQAEPANLLLNQWPLPPIVLTALVVDPADPELETVEHTWALELPDDFEGAEEIEALVPEGPYDHTLTIDLAALFGARDTTWSQGLLPFRYSAKNEDLTRDAVKFAYFLVPEIEIGDDDDSAGDDDDFVIADDHFSADDDDVPGIPGQEEPPQEYNENPQLISLTTGGVTFSTENGRLPGHGGVLYVGEIDPEVGFRFEIDVLDDKSPSDVDAALFWTHGTPGLPSSDPLDELRGDDDDDDDDDDQEEGGGFGGDSASLETAFFVPDRNFGWTPPDDTPDVPVRLFLLLSDADSGVSWIEIRPEDAPAR